MTATNVTVVHLNRDLPMSPANTALTQNTDDIYNSTTFKHDKANLDLDKQ